MYSNSLCEKSTLCPRLLATANQRSKNIQNNNRENYKRFRTKKALYGNIHGVNFPVWNLRHLVKRSMFNTVKYKAQCCTK